MVTTGTTTTGTVTTATTTATMRRRTSLAPCRCRHPAGLTEGLAGTSDIDALIAAQTFEVASVWVFDPATQDFLLHIPGAPAFANSLTSDSLSADSVVLMLRRGDKPDDLGEAPVADDEAPRGVANVLPTPPEGGFTLGVSGTNDPAVLAASQPFEVRLIAMLDVPSQIWLTYIPGGPDFVQTLSRGLLQPESIVWMRAGTAPDPEPEPTATPEPEPTATSEPRADSDAGGNHRRGRDHLLLLQPGDDLGRHRRWWRLV